MEYRQSLDANVSLFWRGIKSVWIKSPPIIRSQPIVKRLEWITIRS